MHSRQRKPKKVLSPEQTYDKGINILNRILETDLASLTPETLEIQYAMAINYILSALLKYQRNNDETNVIATYEMLAKFYEKDIADELIDLANAKVTANELTAAIFYFKLANTYYSKALALKEYSSTPELELHFSVLNALEQLALVDSLNKDFYCQNIADYMAEYNITQQVNNFSAQATTYQKFITGYQRLSHGKRTPETAAQETQPVKKLRNDFNAPVKPGKPSVNLPKLTSRVAELEPFKLAINHFIHQAGDQLNQTVVANLLATIADFYRNHADFVCIPIGLHQKRKFTLHFYQLAATLGNTSAAGTLPILERTYSTLTQYNIFSKATTYRYDLDFQKQISSHNIKINFRKLGSAEYLKQILIEHVDDMFLAGDQRVLLILEHCALYLGKKIAEGALFTRQQNQLAGIFNALATRVNHQSLANTASAESVPLRLAR